VQRLDEIRSHRDDAGRSESVATLALLLRNWVTIAVVVVGGSGELFLTRCPSDDSTGALLNRS
jgi:hypothetical protein